MRKRSIIGAVAALAVAVALGVVATAHAHLEKTEPANGATITTPPPHIQLMFASKIDPAVSLIDMTGPSGAVALGDAHGMDEDKTLMAVVKGEMTNGAYTVNWQAAAADGHPEKGSFTFTLERPATHE